MQIKELQGEIYNWTKMRPSMMDHNLEPGVMLTNLMLELAEVAEVEKFRPVLDSEAYKESLGAELCDVLWYVLAWASLEDIDMAEAFYAKLMLNEDRFPPEQFQGDRRDFLKQYWARKQDLGERK